MRWKRLVAVAALSLPAILFSARGLRAEDPPPPPPDKQVPAKIEQMWPKPTGVTPANPSGVDRTSPNPYHDNPGGTSEPSRVTKITPPMTVKGSDGTVVVRKVCDAHLEILDAQGNNVDPKAEVNSNEISMLEKKGDGTAGAAAARKGKPVLPPRWEGKKVPGGVAWFSPGCSDPMPQEGLHFVVWGGTVSNLKDKQWRNARWRLTDDGRDPTDPPPPPPPPPPPDPPTTPPDPPLPPPATTDPSGHPYRVDVVLAHIRREAGGADDPRRVGYLLPLGAVASLRLESDEPDAGQPYLIRTARTRDADDNDPSHIGIDADTAPVPTEWGLSWQGLSGSLNGQSQAFFQVTVPNDANLLLKTVHVAAVTQPGQPSDVGRLTIAHALTFVHSLEDYDGDSVLNEVDSTPFGEETD